jgi:stress response protein YsnF
MSSIATSECSILDASESIRPDGDSVGARRTRKPRPTRRGQLTVWRSRTRRRTRGRARLRKYVVTEHVQRTIPVQREEVRVEYEPADAGDDQTAPEPPADRPDR